MRIAYVTMVKDEDDIIYQNLLYHYKVGFRDFYIIDNNSFDNTTVLLNRFKDEHDDANVYIEIDKEIAYWQYKKITKLANKAYEDGCDWIFPVDADEFLFQDGNQNFNVYDWLNSIDPSEKDNDYIKYKWWYYRGKELNNTDPLLMMNHRDLIQVSSETKVIVKWKLEMEICQGNHNLHHEEKYKEIECLKNTVQLAHFRIRSLQQMRKKVINLGLAYHEISSEFFHESSINNYRMFLENGDRYIEELIQTYNNEAELEENNYFPSIFYTNE